MSRHLIGAPGLTTALMLVLTLPSRSLPAADAEFPSSWRTTDIAIDGSADEWAGKLIPIPETSISLGIQNDASFVYICLRASDEATRKRILASGLTFYLDGSGKDDRAFGVRYPASPQRPAARDVGDRPEDQSASRPRPMASLDEIEILGKAVGDGGRLPIARAKQIVAALGETATAVVLELKVPLAFSFETPFAVQAVPGKTISLGLDSAPLARVRSEGGRKDREGGEVGMGGRGVGLGTGGGYRPGFGSMGGGRHGGRGGERQTDSGPPSDRAFGPPLKKWFRVPLATAPVTPPAPSAR